MSNRNVPEIKSRILQTMERAQRKAFIQSLELNKHDLTSRFQREREAVSNLLDEFDYSRTNYEFFDELSAALEDSLYFSIQEKKENIELWNMRLKRMITYLQSTGAIDRIHTRQSVVTVPVEGLELNVTVPFNLIVTNPLTNELEVIKFLTNAPVLSTRARKPENKPENSVGLYLMYKAVKQLYPLAPSIKCSFYHLKNKDDSGSEFIAEYEHKAGKNIVSYSFNESEIERMEAKIREIYNADYNLSQLCDTQLCSECPFKEICDRIAFKLKPTFNLEAQSSPEISNHVEVDPTSSQLEFIEFRKGIARVNAAAGTGKTTTLMLRYKNLIASGVNPDRVLLITFTDNAAEEMKEKVKRMGLNVKEEDMKIFTFNGYGMSIIQSYYALLGFTKKPVVIDKIEKYDIIFNLLNEVDIPELDTRNPLLDFPNAKGAVVELALLFDNIKVKELTDEQIAELGYSSVEAIRNTYNRYNQILIERNYVEYQDQIIFCEKLLREYPIIREDYIIEHIMIDEYQDTDHSQSRLVNLLMTIYDIESLVVVGDDAQSIYGFRFADQRNIIDFDKNYENVQDIFMLENYRSTQEILTTANLLNEFNQNRIPKMITSGAGLSGPRPQRLLFENKDVEFANIRGKILSLRDTVGLSNMAIISRTGQELDEIRDYLVSENIPSTVLGSTRYIDSPTVKMIMSYAEVLANRQNTLSLFEYLIEAFSPEEIQMLLTMNAQSIKLLLEHELAAIPTFEENEEFLKVVYFFDFWDSQDLDPIGRDFIEFLKEKDFTSLDDLAYFSLKMCYYQDDTIADIDKVKMDAVNLITAHSAKGMEFNTCFILLDKFGVSNRLKTTEDFDEERRLLFVAATRAKQNLFFTHTKSKKQSPFIPELLEVDVFED